jgi:uridine kinase
VRSFESVSTWRQPEPAPLSAARTALIEAVILIVDSVFGQRPEYERLWDYRIWLDVMPEVALVRGIARDIDAEGVVEATRVRRDRYSPAEAIYVTEVDPLSKADIVIDNNDLGDPRVVPRDSN